jgi:CheY-like chemotaxis protein
MNRTVLLVGEDASDRAAILTGVARYHETFSVFTVADAEDAAAALARGLICLIVLDIESANLDGVRFFSETRLSYPDIPIILLGGRGVERRPAGVLARHSKPLNIGELTRTMFQALKKQADGGIMPGVSPAVFVQLVEMENWTCTMRLVGRDTDQGGILFFRNGQLLDARTCDQRGLAAAQRIFTWDGTTLFIENDCVLTANRINSELQPIIMQAVILKDDPMRRTTEAEPPESGDEDEIVALSDDDLVWAANDEDVLDRVDHRIRHEIGVKCDITDRYFDEGRIATVEGLHELGWRFGLGRFMVGSLHQSGRPDQILLSNQPPVVLHLCTRSRQEQILQALRPVAS